MRSIDRSGRWQRRVVIAWLALIVVVGGASGTAAADTGNSQNAHLCQKGGWMDLVTSDGRGFSNAGHCTSYAARGGTLMPANPYPEAKALCESFGGTFGVGGPDLAGGHVWSEVLWVCNGWGPATGGDAFMTRNNQLIDACFAEGARYAWDYPGGLVASTCGIP